MILHNKNIRVSILLLFMILLLVYIPAHADVSFGFMDDLVNKITNKAAGFRDVFATAAISLYMALVTIELALDTGQELLKGSNGMKFIGIIIVRMSMMMIWIAIIKDPSFVTASINQALSLATEAGGVAVSNLTPSKTAGLGVLVFQNFMDAIHAAKFSLADPMTIVYGLIIIIIGFAVIILFALMGIMFFITKIESTFVIAVGVVMMGFLGSTWTSQNGKAYITYIIAVCIKLIVTILIISIVIDVTNDWATKVSNAAGLFELINVSVGIVLDSMTLLFLVMTIPALAAGICTGVSTASLTGALAAGGAVLAAGATLAAGAGSLADMFKSLGNKGMDPGDIDMDTGTPSSGDDGSSGGATEDMAPKASSPEAPSSGEAEGGISGGESNSGNSESGGGERQGAGLFSKHAGNATRLLKEAEGNTTVQPPSISSKHSEF